MHADRLNFGVPCRYGCKRKTCNRKGVCSACLLKHGRQAHKHTLGERCPADEPERARRVELYARYVRIRGRMPDDYAEALRDPEEAACWPCFWGCGAMVDAPARRCRACQADYDAAAVGMPEWEHFHPRAFKPRRNAVVA